MQQLAHSRKLTFAFIPTILALDFEQYVLNVYFDSGYHDITGIAGITDYFAVYTVSFNQTGDPYALSDSLEERTEKDLLIIEHHFSELMEDVSRVLDHHRLFHAWRDRSNQIYYDFDTCYHMPFTQVW